MDILDNTIETKLKELLVQISGWFAENPEASADCRRYVEDNSDLSSDLLDRVFNEVEEEFLLPDEVYIDKKELNNINGQDEETVRNIIINHIEEIYGNEVLDFNTVTDNPNTNQIIVDGIIWKEDSELAESYMSDLATEVEEKGGKEAYLSKLENDIKEQKQNLKDCKKEIEYLEHLSLVDLTGTNYDNESEVEEALEGAYQNLEDIQATLTHLYTIQDLVKGLERPNKEFNEGIGFGNNSSKVVNDYKIEVYDSAFDGSSNEDNSFVEAEIYKNDLKQNPDSHVLKLHFFGLSSDDIELQTSTETWSDPGDYPNSLGSGALPNRDYLEVNDADIDFGNMELKFYTEDEVSISEEEAKAYLGVNDDEFNNLLKKTMILVQVAYKQAVLDWAVDLDESELEELGYSLD